jgi:3-isopropylmalate/(R)-2-methylmalate dehydratase small subunit
VKDNTNGEILTFGKIPGVMLKILNEGGLIPYIQKHGDIEV